MPAAWRYHLRKDKIRELRGLLDGEVKALAEKLREDVEVFELAEGKLVVAQGEPVFILGERPVPHLGIVGELGLKEVVVDMGAVGPVCRGADVMAPGVVRADSEIRIGELVVVTDERHRKPLAVGEALVPGERMSGREGRVVKNLHHVGDKFWKLQL
jgi:PUA domain protein